jgi:hypothetical protein
MRRFGFAAILVAAAFTLACGSSPSGPSSPAGNPTVPVMGPARLTASQLANWFSRRQPQPAGVYGATEPVAALATYFIEEGALEGVAGDVAFVQSIIETGWFRFSGAVPGSKNNFAGIGAVHRRSRSDPASARVCRCHRGVVHGSAPARAVRRSPVCPGYTQGPRAPLESVRQRRLGQFADLRKRHRREVSGGAEFRRHGKLSLSPSRPNGR